MFENYIVTGGFAEPYAISVLNYAVNYLNSSSIRYHNVTDVVTAVLYFPIDNLIFAAGLDNRLWKWENYWT